MKKLYTVSTGIVIALFSLFIFHGVSFAAGTLYGQTFTSATTGGNMNAVSWSGGRSGVGQKLGTNLYGTVTTSTIYFATGGGLGPITMNWAIICYDDAAYTTYNGGCSSSVAGETIAASHAKTLYTKSMPVTFNTSKYYRFEMGCSGGCGGGTNPTVNTYGSNSERYPDGDFSAGYTIVDMYFEIIGDADPSVFIYNVLDQGTYADFAYWLINLYGTGTNIDDISPSQIRISYKVLGATDWQYEDSATWQFPYVATHFPIPKTQSLLPRVCTSTYECFFGGGAAVGQQNWVAKVELFDPDGVLLSAASEITFEVNDGVITIDYNATTTQTLSPYAMPNTTSTASLGLSYETCGGGIDFSCGLKNAMIFTVNALFIPGKLGASATFLTDANQEFKTVFPFNLFYGLTQAVTNQLNNFDSGTPATLALSITFPAVGSTPAATSSVTFANGTVLKDTVFGGSSTVLAWWYNTILMIVIVMFGYALFSVIFHPHDY